MRRSRALALVASTLACATRPAFAQSSSSAQVRIGGLPIESGSECYYAQEQGFFQRYGIDASIETLSNAGAIVAAALAGAIDIGNTNIVTLAQAYAKGLPLALVAPGAVYSEREPTTELVVADDAPYRTAKDLTGKKIAVLTLGGFLQVAVQQWLDRNGGDAKSVTFLELPSSEIVPALVARRVDAAGLPEPFRSSDAAKQSVRAIAAPYSSVGKRLMLSAWVANRAWVDANPAALLRFQTALRDTATWANAHREASAAILARYTHLPEATIAAMRRDPFAVRADASTIQPIIDVCATYQLIPRAFAATDLFAPNLN